MSPASSCMSRGFTLVLPVVAAVLSTCIMAGAATQQEKAYRSKTVVAVISPETAVASALISSLNALGVNTNVGGEDDPVLRAPSPNSKELSEVFVTRAIFLAAHPSPVITDLFRKTPVTLQQVNARSTCDGEHCSLSLGAGCLSDAASFARCDDGHGADPLHLGEMVHNWMHEDRLYPVLFLQPHWIVEQAEKVAAFVHTDANALKTHLVQRLSGGALELVVDPIYKEPKVQSLFGKVHEILKEIGRAHLSPVRRPPNVKFVHFPVDGGVGFNNMRESMTAAVFIAKIIGRGIIFPYVFTLEEAFDLYKLGKHVPIALATDFPEQMTKSTTQCSFNFHWNPYHGDESIKRFDKPECVVLFMHGVYWDYVRYTFPFASYKTNLEAVYRDIDYNEDFYEIARILRMNLPERYIAVHYRVGDRVPFPLADCSKPGLKAAAIRNLPCLKTNPPEGIAPSRAFLTLEELILEQAKPGETIFVATNELVHPYSKIFVETLTKRGFRVVTFGDLRKGHVNPVALAQAEFSMAHHRYHVSSVDQLLCYMSDLYFATFDSSWDEFVIERRRWDGKPGGEEMGRLFDKKITHFMQGKERYPSFRDDILPNLLVKCPPGYTQSVDMCLCPKDQRCTGPKCDRGVDPVSKLPARGFHYPCDNCTCNLPASRPNAPKFFIATARPAPYSSAAESCKLQGGVVAFFDSADEFEDASDACCKGRPVGQRCYVAMTRPKTSQQRADWKFDDGRPANDETVIKWQFNNGGFYSSTRAGFACYTGLLVDFGQGTAPIAPLCRMAT